MYSSPYSLERRTGRNGTNRFDYLKQLINEYETTQKEESKDQILANLANFAYDPINYEYFRRLNVIEIFLKILTTPVSNEKHLEFAIQAVCNLCLDEKNKDFLLCTKFIARIIEIFCLNSSLAMKLNIMTILIFINCDQVRSELEKSKDFIEQIHATSQSPNKRLGNLATLLLNEVINLQSSN